jgi:DNA polymerase III alpha subunit
MDIRALSHRTQEHLVQERQRNGPYADMENFLSRTRARRSEIRSLIQVGALEGLGLAQPQMMLYLDDHYGRAPRPGNSLFDTSELENYRLDQDDYNLTVKCLNELHLLGFMLSGDILSILDLHPAFKGALPCRNLGRYAGRRVKIFGWPITGRLHTVPGKGQMKFLTIEDSSGYGDAVFWPEVYKRFFTVLSRPGPYEIWGRVQEDWGTFSLIADRVKSVRWSPNQVDFELAAQRLSKSLSMMHGRYEGWVSAVA